MSFICCELERMNWGLESQSAAIEWERRLRITLGAVPMCESNGNAGITDILIWTCLFQNHFRRPASFKHRICRKKEGLKGEIIGQRIITYYAWNVLKLCGLPHLCLSPPVSRPHYPSLKGNFCFLWFLIPLLTLHSYQPVILPQATCLQCIRTKSKAGADAPLAITTNAKRRVTASWEAKGTMSRYRRKHDLTSFFPYE